MREREIKKRERKRERKKREKKREREGKGFRQILKGHRRGMKSNCNVFSKNNVVFFYQS